MYQDDIEYASKRLNDTLVRLKGNVPFFINSTGYDDRRVITHTGTNYLTNRSNTVEHKDIDLEPVPLGFVNGSENMMFVCRKPLRRDWKQGLSMNSIVIYGSVRREDFRMKLLVQPITNQYPPFQRALDILEDKKSVAFSRDFGMIKSGKDLSLVYRKYSVGRVENGVPILNRDKFFLQQHLEEALVA